MISEGAESMTGFMNLLFTSKNILMKTQLLELITAVTTFSEAGHTYVLKAEEVLGEERMHKLS